jgi:hypothetical protein
MPRNPYDQGNTRLTIAFIFVIVVLSVMGCCLYNIIQPRLDEKPVVNTYNPDEQ